MKSRKIFKVKDSLQITIIKVLQIIKVQDSLQRCNPWEHALFRIQIRWILFTMLKQNRKNQINKVVFIEREKHFSKLNACLKYNKEHLQTFKVMKTSIMIVCRKK